MRLAETRQVSQKTQKSPRRKSQPKSESQEHVDDEVKEAKRDKSTEKRVSFDDNNIGDGRQEKVNLVNILIFTVNISYFNIMLRPNLL